MKCSVVVAAALALARGGQCAIDADEVRALPGLGPGPLPSKQYSGLLPAGAGQHIHYHLSLSEGSPSTDPLVLWVQGGPGGSSMLGMFTEVGQWLVVPNSSDPALKAALIPNPGSWSKHANMLYWEAPAGVGFSGCDGGQCPQYNDTTSAIYNAQFLCSFFAAYPEYASNDFYLAGESYAGVYIPTLVLQIMQGAPACTASINLKGLAIGNGCTGADVGPCSPGRGVNTFNQLSAHGMLSQRTQRLVNEACADSLSFTQPSEACVQALLAASHEAGAFNNYDVQDTCGPPSNPNQFAHMLCGWTQNAALCGKQGAGLNATLLDAAVASAAAFPPPEDNRAWADGLLLSASGRNASAAAAAAAAAAPMSKMSARVLGGADDTEETGAEAYPCGMEAALDTYLNNPAVIKAIHMDRANQSSWQQHDISYTRSYGDLVAKMPAIIANYRVLIYSGDFDGQIPHGATEDWVTGLAYPIKSAWAPWTLPTGQVAGYAIDYDVPTQFTYLTVKGAGHQVPTFRPREAAAMIGRFLNGSSFSGSNCE